MQGPFGAEVRRFGQAAQQERVLKLQSVTHGKVARFRSGESQQHVHVIGQGERCSANYSAVYRSRWSAPKSEESEWRANRLACFHSTFSALPRDTSQTNRGNWRSFERVVAAVVDAVLSPNAETIVAHRVVRLSA
jgi:hypothetical protein